MGRYLYYADLFYSTSRKFRFISQVDISYFNLNLLPDKGNQLAKDVPEVVY